MPSGEKLTPRLIELYQAIDQAYDSFAQEVGLTCEGCDGVRCCTVDLTLYTFLEMHFLRVGFSRLDPSVQAEIRERRREVLQAKEEDPKGDAYRNSVCVANVDGKCALYEHRPMICRLAGLPHFLVRPDGHRLERGGCSRYDQQIDEAFQHLKMDRTKFYETMAFLEMEVVNRVHRRTRPQTVAEALCKEEPESDSF